MVGIKPPAENITVRLPVELIKRVDQYAGVVQARVAGVQVGRSGAVRELLLRALDLAEPEAPKAA